MTNYNPPVTLIPKCPMKPAQIPLAVSLICANWKLFQMLPVTPLPKPISN